MNKVAIITGASSGMGKAAAFELQQIGYKVYGMARRTDKMKDLTAVGMGVIALDLTQEASIVHAVHTFWKRKAELMC